MNAISISIIRVRHQQLSQDNNVLNVTCTPNSNQSILLVDLFMFASINSFSIKWNSFQWNFACLRNRFDYSILYKYNLKVIFDILKTIVRSDCFDYVWSDGFRWFYMKVDLIRLKAPSEFRFFFLFGKIRRIIR